MIHRQQAHPVRQFVRQPVLIVISTGKVGIEMPHRKLTGNGKGLHILIAIGIGHSDSSQVISEFPLSIG